MNESSDPTPEPLDQRLHLMVSTSFLEQLDRWRRAHTSPPGRSAAVRELAIEAMTRAEAGSPIAGDPEVIGRAVAGVALGALTPGRACPKPGTKL